ncbi:MAG: hypothetical protein JW908_09670 [Anaerolineales bacterium]|nr:hypothetical protein [Anaerolineales bacterium]
MPGGVQGLDRYAYVNNNPLKYIDSDGHNPLLIIIAIAGFAMMMSQYPGDGAYAYQNSEGNGDVMAWGAALMLAPIIVPASCMDDGCAHEVQSVMDASQIVNQDGNPTNELETAVSIGQIPIENVTPLTKIASQLNSKAGILGIPKSGNLGSLSNPVVQTSLSRLNTITSSATSQIYSGTYHKIPVFEYIDEGIGVMRNQSTGALVTVFDRAGPEIDKLYYNVNNGLGMWLR